MSGGLALKIGKKQGLALSSAAVSTSAHTGKTTGPQTTTHGNNVKSMKTSGAILTACGVGRDLSANSDKAAAGTYSSTVQNAPALSNSLLKQKSRNRCNENLNIGGAAGTGSGMAVGGQVADNRGHINNTHSNIETAY